MTFLLTTERWIPCRRLDGSPAELGLFDALAHAHEIEGLRAASPPATLALNRLLLGILHHVFGPGDLRGWTMLYRAGAFDATRLGAYFQAQEARFDLLHPERPFMQVRGLTKLYEPSGLGRLLLVRSNYGTEVNVFQHRNTAAAIEDTLALPQAAQALLVLQGFAPGGWVKKKGEPDAATAAPLHRGAFVLVHGRTLFETLMHNLLVYAPERDLPVPAGPEPDIPSWEQPELPRQVGVKETSRRPRGWVDWLTWQSRRLELVIDEQTRRVSGVVYCVGQGLADEGLTDPMLAYRVDKKRGFVPIDLSDDRATWRDCHALVRSVGADGARPPAAITQLARVELRPVFAMRQHLILDVIGMRGDQAKIRLARHERLSLPAGLLADPERLAAIGQGTGLAEQVGLRLTFAIRDAVRVVLAPGGRDPDPEDVRRVTESLGAERSYWASLEVPFERLLEDLAETEIGRALDAFFGHVRCAARDTLRLATGALGTGAAKLHGAAVAERHLSKALRDILPAAGVVRQSGGPP